MNSLSTRNPHTREERAGDNMKNDLFVIAIVAVIAIAAIVIMVMQDEEPADQTGEAYSIGCSECIDLLTKGEVGNPRAECARIGYCASRAN